MFYRRRELVQPSPILILQHLTVTNMRTKEYAPMYWQSKIYLNITYYLIFKKSIKFMNWRNVNEVVVTGYFVFPLEFLITWVIKHIPDIKFSLARG